VGFFQRGYALVLMMAVVVLVAISAFSFLNNLGQGRSDSVSGLMKAINGQNLTTQEANQIVLDDSRPSLTLTGDRVSLSDKHFHGVLRFDLPSGIQGQIVDQNTNKKVFTCVSADTCTLKPQYNNSMIQVQLLTSSPEAGGEYEFQKNIPLKALNDSILSRVVFPIDIPMTGYPDLYPQDYYFFDILMSFSLPSNMTRLINGKAPTGTAADHYAIDPGNITESQDMTAKPLTDSKGKPASGEFHISIRRQTRSQYYIYSVALIPLIFALLFLHLLFFSSHFTHKVFEEFTEALIVAILAVLPLRVVLVPASLEGLTRVDLILGLGLVFIVAVAVGKYATEVWGSSRSDPPSPHVAEVDGAHPVPSEVA
jgi:hypothetical protein